MVEKLRQVEGDITIEKEINPEFIREVESSVFSLTDKVNILLTMAGLKPASKVELTSRIWHGDEEERFFTDGDVAKVRQLIENSGMPFESAKEFELTYWYGPKPEVEAYNQEGAVYIIGHTQQDLERLKEAMESKDPVLKGKAFGFPETATEAFCGKKRKKSPKSLPKEVKKSDAWLFHYGPLSESNWKEELVCDQKRAEFIKKVSPRLYKEMTEK
ncbi:MAG: hypothetical protein NTU76_01205 [Candidatus Taylorbacteria bacterium]|nr:hypothetical protein [Candidatus Taylorbacteria bacterium]